ncbi:MAG TPA: sulfite exporter TauE/SafE family protein, partial [Armatimonadota bacterium]|nr:sulfite exporter TauE/SafE family protein [Armatimonadota bacterium]
MSTIIGAPLLGLTIGFLVGMTGLGGGALMTPALILILKMEPIAAIGTDLIYASITKFVGAVKHIRLGNVRWRIVKYLSYGSIPGALVGSYLVSRVELDATPMLEVRIQQLLGVMLILVAAIIVWRAFRAGPVEGAEERKDFVGRRHWVVLLGVLVGMLVSLTSVGSGAIVMAALLLWFPLGTSSLVGTDIVHAVVLLGVAGLSHLIQGHADLRVSGLLL